MRLRDLIIEGAYLPGQRLPQARLMDVLRVGRTPLRNALSRLQNDGLVIATPNHGFAVAPVPISSAEEIYTLRLVVEPPLLEALAPGISDGQLERMRELLRHMEECLEEPVAFQRAHREYHTVERATFASPFIDELVLNMYRHLYRHQRTRLVRTRTPIDFLRLDRETVDALSAGDWLRARRALEFHLVDAAISFLADADPTHSPTMLVSVARANGIIVETANDGTVPVPASIGWATPCPTLPPLRTAHLVYEPVGRAGDVALTEGNEIVLVSAPAADQARQDIPVLFGISGTTAGTTGLSLHLTSFPPGGNSNAHMHVGYETAICGVRGAAELFYGERLERSVVITEGSFCFIPPGLPHKAYNLSETEGAQFVTARNDPADQEHVVVTPEADDGSADDRVRRSRARHAAGGLDSSL